MAFNIDENGNISMVQGDSGTIVIEGLDESIDYVVYLAIQDKNRKPVGNELYVNSNNSSTVVFKLTSDFTNLLAVDKNENYAIYNYGIKLCDVDENTEETIVMGDGEIGSINTITVFPKKVEGLNNG